MDYFDKLSESEKAMALIKKHIDSYAIGGTEEYVACHGETVTIAAKLGEGVGFYNTIENNNKGSNKNVKQLQCTA